MSFLPIVVDLSGVYGIWYLEVDCLFMKRNDECYDHLGLGCFYLMEKIMGMIWHVDF